MLAFGYTSYSTVANMTPASDSSTTGAAPASHRVIPPELAEPVRRASQLVCQQAAWQTACSISRHAASPLGCRGPDRACYGVMKSGRIRARTIAKTPNSVSAPSPKFRRVRRVDSIEVVRRLIEGGFLDVPRPERSSVSRFQRMYGERARLAPKRLHDLVIGQTESAPPITAR
jgi:hypothetical protein